MSRISPETAPTAGYAVNTSNTSYQELLAEAGGACALCPEKYLPRSGSQILARSIGGEIINMTAPDVAQQFSRDLAKDETLGQGWLLTMNSFPYVNTAGRVDGSTPVKGHMLILPERHLTSPGQLKDHDDFGIRGRDHFMDLCDAAREEHGAHLGGIAMRFYDPNAPWPAGVHRADGHEAAGLTLPHLHGHILVPQLDPETGYVPGHGTPDDKVVNFSIG